MREGFIDFMQHYNNDQPSHGSPSDLMQHMLDPTKFIQRHFGNEGIKNPEFMFNEIISELPQQ